MKHYALIYIRVCTMASPSKCANGSPLAKLSLTSNPEIVPND
jgi:hypothetical protein